MQTDEYLRAELGPLDLQQHVGVVFVGCVAWILVCTIVAFVAATELEQSTFEIGKSPVSDQNDIAHKVEPHFFSKSVLILDCNRFLEPRIQNVEAELAEVTQRLHQLEHRLRRDSLSPRRRSVSSMSPTPVQDKSEPDRTTGVNRIKTCIQTFVSAQNLLHRLPVRQIFALMLTKEMTKGLAQDMAWLPMATPVVLTLEIFCYVNIDVRDAQPIAEWLQKTATLLADAVEVLTVVAYMTLRNC